MLRHLLRSDRGEGPVSYIAVLLLIAAVAGALVTGQVPGAVVGVIERSVCRVAQQQCEPGGAGAHDGGGNAITTAGSWVLPVPPGETSSQPAPAVPISTWSGPHQRLLDDDPLDPDPELDGAVGFWNYFWEKHNQRHNAVQNALLISPTGDELPRRDTEIRVRGGGPNGGDGYVDVVEFHDDETLIWEVKPYTRYGRRTGEPQLRRYLAAAENDWESEAVPGGFQTAQVVEVPETGELLVAFSLIAGSSLDDEPDTEDEQISESVRYYVPVDRLREDADLREELERQLVPVDELLQQAEEVEETRQEQEDDGCMEFVVTWCPIFS